MEDPSWLHFSTDSAEPDFQASLEHNKHQHDLTSTLQSSDWMQPYLGTACDEQALYTLSALDPWSGSPSPTSTSHTLRENLPCAYPGGASTFICHYG